MSTTLGQMLDRIADETRYTDSASRTIFQLCILDAVAHYEKETFWFNQSRAITFNTVADQKSYGSSDNASIPYIQDFDAVTLTRATNDSYTLTKIDWTEIEFLNPDSDTTGPPYRYAYWQQKIWFDPVPDAVYPVVVSGEIPLSTLSSDSDTNAWTTTGEGEELIRSRAKTLFYTSYTRDDANATRSAQKEADAYSKLRESTIRKNQTNQVRMFL